MEKKEWNQIANNYYDEILSPIKNSSYNPILKDLKKIQDKNKKVVIDLGCGLGEMAPILSESFKNVLSIDFSEEMINLAKNKNKDLQNVEFRIGDMTDLKDLKESYDVAVSINSIISGDIKKIGKMFREAYNTLVPGGTFICILPAMEVYAYQSLLIAEKEFDKTDDEKQVIHTIRKDIKNKEHNFILGLVDFEGVQKAYYRFEIAWRFKKIGFKNIRIKKVFYPWDEFRKAGQTYFPEEDLPWDWYVICEK